MFATGAGLGPFSLDVSQAPVPFHPKPTARPGDFLNMFALAGLKPAEFVLAGTEPLKLSKPVYCVK